jgi:hypothetical protein
MKDASLKARPKRKERILKQAAAGTSVLLKLDGGQYFALNEVGGRIWDLCDGRHTVSEIIAILSSEYDMPAETIEHDLGELLTNLANENLVDQNTQKIDDTPAAG